MTTFIISIEKGVVTTTATLKRSERCNVAYQIKSRLLPQQIAAAADEEGKKGVLVSASLNTFDEPVSIPNFYASLHLEFQSSDDKIGVGRFDYTQGRTVSLQSAFTGDAFPSDLKRKTILNIIRLIGSGTDVELRTALTALIYASGNRV
jgi:hypothetical protein